MTDREGFQPVHLTTPRLVLRDMREEDWRALRAVDGDAEVVRYQSNDVLDEAGTRAYVARTMASAREVPRRTYDLAITRPPDDLALGRVGLRVVRPEHREAELWFTLRRDAWGQGLASETAAAMVAFAFTQLGLHRVYGDCDPRNERSAKLMEKLGMIREAHLRENWWLKGEWCGSYIYAVLEDEWRARK